MYPFNCDQCLKGFMTEEQLFKHKNSHCKLKYQCDICGKHFPHENNLLKHFQSDHENENNLLKHFKGDHDYVQKVTMTMNKNS